MITIFTPTYNREKLLKRCYESLEQQTDKNFEWLVADDGSTDGTREFIESVQKKADFKVKYLYQENGGKHRAFNLAVRECKNDFMLILDSDDMLVMDAAEVLNRKICGIVGNRKICGIVGNMRNNIKNRIIGVRMPDVEYASGLELYQKMGFHGDTLRLYKTSVLKKYQFPEIEGEKFIPENVVFDRIDKKYKMLVIPEVLYLSEYQETGLSKNINKVRIENPIGYSLSLKSTAETALTMKKKLGVTILYIMWVRKFKIKNTFSSFGNKFIYVVCWPLSFIFQALRLPKFYYNMFKGKNYDRQ